MEYEPFFIYREIEWVITDEKTLIQNLYERLTIQNELKKLKNFLKHSVIILNVDKKFDQEKDISEKSREGTAIVRQILSLLQDVSVEGKILSIRWHLNPTEDILISELLNPDTRYFFADFHTEKGEWKIPGGKDNSGARIFKKLKKNTLSHIRLMRIFHCDSAARVDTFEAKPSIVSLLLEAGALRVEGGIGGEDYIEYLCSLLYILHRDENLKLVLAGKCHETGTDFNVLIEGIKKFLISCNWELPELPNAEKNK